jgi:ABC-type sulfate transport system permease component
MRKLILAILFMILAGGSLSQAQSLVDGSLSAQIVDGNIGQTVTLSGIGAGLTSATCILSCTQSRGTIQVVNGSSASTAGQAIVTVTFSIPTPHAAVCMVTQEGGNTWYGLKHTVNPGLANVPLGIVAGYQSLGFSIVAHDTIEANANINIQYECQL